VYYSRCRSAGLSCLSNWQPLKCGGYIIKLCCNCCVVIVERHKTHNQTWDQFDSWHYALCIESSVNGLALITGSLLTATLPPILKHLAHTYIHTDPPGLDPESHLSCLVVVCLISICSTIAPFTIVCVRYPQSKQSETGGQSGLSYLSKHSFQQSEETIASTCPNPTHVVMAVSECARSRCELLPGFLIERGLAFRNGAIWSDHGGHQSLRVDCLL